MGWLMACLFAVLLWRTRRRLKTLLHATPSATAVASAQPALASYQHIPLAYQHLHNLVVLSLELNRLREAGTLHPAQHADLTAQIDTLWTNIVRHLGAAPHSQAWHEARTAAWELLIDQYPRREPPPWAEGAASPPPVETHEADIFTPPAHLQEKLLHHVEIPPLPAAAWTPPPAPAVTVSAAPEALAEAAQPGSATPPRSAADTASYAWEPTAPSALERAMQTMAGWPALIAPFLVQNIGWFIGGLCFVAGSIFLVTYTTGFAKTLTSFAVLSVYTLLLLWAGYQIRRRQPALEMSSSALLILGMLLVPLNVAAAVRLLLSAQMSPGLLALGLLAVGIGVGGLYVTATLVSGILDRDLQRQHPRLFLGLASVQLAVPVLVQLPFLPLLVVCHGVLLAVLAYGVVLFTRDWLHAIFIERRTLAYYAAGTLVYAALVSFVHVTWGYQDALELPPGYYGPLLLVVCGLLFYVDAHLTPWRQQAAVLSYLSFGLYGLSIIALLLAVKTPLALLCTLILAVALYGFVTWQYATLPPLYLLLGCTGWLYHEVMLHHLPYAWYFVGSLPAWVGLWAVSRWALQRRATTLALVGYRVLVVAMLSVAAWSVAHAQPGWVALVTALLVMAGAFAAPRVLPMPLLSRRQAESAEDGAPLSWPPSAVADAGDGAPLSWPPSAVADAGNEATSLGLSGAAAQSLWLYLGTGAGLVAVAYAPPVPGLAWALQFTWGLLLLATVWAAQGLRLSRIARAEASTRSAALLNSAVLSLGVCLGVWVVSGLPDATYYRSLPLLLGVEGGLALWLSLALGVQWLFYGVLGLWAVAAALVQVTYFPASGSGLTMMGTALLIWAALWWVERAPVEVTTLRQERAALRGERAASLTLLWCCPVTFQPPQTVVRVPLQQAMVLVWSLGIIQLGWRLLEDTLKWSWPISAVLAALVAVLITGSLAWPRLLSVAMTLGLGAWLVTAYKLGVTTVVGVSVGSAAYALLVWHLGVILLAHPAVRRLARVCHLRGDRTRLEHIAHWTAFTMTALSLGIPLVRYGVFIPQAAFVLTLVTGMVFWGLTAWRYQRRLHRYLVIESGMLGGMLLYSWSLYAMPVPLLARWQAFLSAPDLGLTCVLLSTVLWGIACMVRRFLVTMESYTSSPANAPGEELHLYVRPLQVVALQMALLAIAQALRLLMPAVLGWEYSAGFFSLGVLGLAGISLLFANHGLGAPGLNLAGVGCMVLAVLGSQSLWWHHTPVAALWFGNPRYIDQWVTLAVLALGLASLARYASQQPHWLWPYTSALDMAARLTYGWALLEAMVLFALLPFQPAGTVVWVFLVLALALLPLAQPLPRASIIRGIGVALLLSAGVVSVLASAGWNTYERCLFIMWAYALWSLGNFVLPRFNASWPRWAIAPDIWPWLGLLLVSGALTVWGLPWLAVSWAEATPLGMYLAAVALYLFLLLHNSAWGAWPWLAVGTLTCAGLVGNAAVPWALATGWMLRLPPGGMAMPWGRAGGEIVWANMLLLGVMVWRRYGPAAACRLGWQAQNLTLPLLVWPSGVLGLWLLYLAVWDALGILAYAGAAVSLLHGGPTLLLGLLLSVSWIHVVWLHSAGWALHSGMAALCLTLLAAWLGSVAPVLHPPLFLALWSVLLVAVTAFAARRQWPVQALAVVRAWRNWSPAAMVIVWLMFPYVSLAEHLVLLGLLSVYAAGLGWQCQQSVWLCAALVLGVIQLHGWWLVWLAPQHVLQLLPWYTLQLAVLTWLVQWAQRRIQRTIAAGDAGTGIHTVPLQPVAQALTWLLPLLTWCTLLAWGLHVLSMLASLQMARTPQWLFGRGEGVVAVLAILAWMAAEIAQIRQTPQAWRIYGVAVVGGTIWAYVRLLWVGLAPLHVWDTVALIGMSYALFILQRFVYSEPLFHVVLLLPLLAVATAPLQLASVYASGTFLTVACLYLGMRQTTGRSFPLYMGLLTLNVGLYLWVPAWAQTYRVLQLYTIPAVLSVLWLLHVHRHELRPPVLHSCRLAASSLLYVSVTLDVFLRAEVTIFLAALGVSLVGILIGIALRTRAFLYAGTSFLVLNIVGQLILLFPEQRLTRAIVLLALGTLITGSMIWFNIQREAILQRIRIFRADLAMWA
jgi:hypothetical protein